MRFSFSSLVAWVCVGGVVACTSAPSPRAESPDRSSTPADGDERSGDPHSASSDAESGARLWAFAQQDPPARFTLESTPAGEVSGRVRCPGPSFLCAERAALWDVALDVGGIFSESAVGGRCELTDVERLEGTHVCGGSLEGQRVIIGRFGDDVTVRLAGNAAFPRLSFESPPFALAPADPLLAGYAQAERSQNVSSETAHLALLTEPLENAAETGGFGTPEAARAAVVEAGVDPQTLSVQRAARLARRLMDARFASLRLPAERRGDLAREIVEVALYGEPSARLHPEQRVAPAEAARGPAQTRWVRTEEGTGPRPAQDGVVALAHQAWDAEGRLLTSRRGRLAMASLGHTWRELLGAMRAGESRRVWLPRGAAASVVSIRLEEADVPVPPPAPPMTPPAGAATLESGLTMELITRVESAVRPTADQELQVSFAGWNAAGRLLRFEPDRLWRSYAFTGDDSVEVGATQHLRVGERARFWVPSEALQDSRRPADEMAVFEVELIAVQ